MFQSLEDHRPYLIPNLDRSISYHISSLGLMKFILQVQQSYLTLLCFQDSNPC